MNPVSREGRLLNVLEAEKKRLPYLLDSLRYRRESIAVGAALNAIADHSKTMGMINYYLNNDVSGLKQCFHVTTRLTLAATGKEGGPGYEIGREIFFALLSDNPACIDSVARIETPLLLAESSNPKRSRFYVHLLQLAILGEDGSLREKINLAARKGPKRDREKYEQGTDFFSLLLRRDQRRLEELIEQSAKTRSEDPLIQDFMPFFATMEGKICWLKGIEVQIKNPAFPMSLMPIKPLKIYDDIYDFLSPDFVPPEMGWMQRLRYRFR